MKVADPLVGSVLGGRYRVDGTIARGGMAMVYLGTDLATERQVAIKVMHAHLAADNAFVQRFEREAVNASRLVHPNLVSVDDQGRDGDIVYLIMEYLESVTLRKELRHRGTLTPRQAIVVTDAVLAALEVVHAAGMIHRDLKPDNVLLGTDGRIKLTDFGLARAVTTATTTKTLIGTVGYVAPELVTRAGADARTDLYTLGIMLYEMLTGSQPYTDEVPIQVAYRHVHDRVPAPSTVVPGLPSRIDAIVLWATSPEPEDRPESATAMREALREARAELTDAQLDFGAATPVDTPVLTATAPVDVPDVRTSGEIPYVASGAGDSGDGGAGDSGGSGDSGDSIDSGDGDAPGTRDLGALAPTTAIPGTVTPIKRKRRRVLFATIAAVAVAALVLTGLTWTNSLKEAPRAVPSVTAGVQQEDATSMIEAAGLTVAIQQEFSSEIPTGRILKTEPDAGTQLQPGGVVTLVVSKGRDLVEVPDLTGLKKEEADTLAKDTGVSIGRVDQRYADEPKGQIIEQSVAHDEKVERGRRIDVVVSKGIEPISVPNVKGLEFQSGYGKLLKLGFRVGKDEQFSDSVPKGRIISQYPAPGTAKYPDDLILLRVSKGKQPPEEDKKDAKKEDAKKDAKKAPPKDAKKG